MKKKNNFLDTVNEVSKNINKLKQIETDFYKSANLLNKTFAKNKVIFCGNGGSAADASHAVAEFVGRYLKKGRRSLNAISLNENNATMTALANDFAYKFVFSRQLEGIGKKGDVLFTISTSGKSENIKEVIKTAKSMKIKTILLTGDHKMSKKICDICIKVPAKRVDRIQELHIIVLHLIAEYVDNNIN